MRGPLFTSVVVLACGMLTAVAQQDEKIVPVHQEPRHHLVFDSPTAKILDVQVPPGDTTLYHTHSDPILYVAMANSQTRSQTLGREWSGGDASRPATPSTFRVGRMTFSPYPQPVTHRVNNIGEGMFRLIGIINASGGDESTAASADFPAEPEINNRWFRGYRWKLGTVKPTEHRHANPVAIVHVAGRAVTEGSSTTMMDKPGTFAWIEATTPHRIEGRGADAEVVEVEIRHPR